MQAARAFDGYFRSVIAERRVAPRDDSLSALAQAEDEGERLTERETLNMLRLLIIAGNETTTNLIGNGMLALLRKPDQLRRLREDPSLIPSAVEELLRYDPPAQAFFRRALADCAVNGFELRAKDNVVLLVGAANRDGQAFDDPDRLEVGRAVNPHLTLGRGIHYCLGAPLSRLEGRIVFETLLERFPEIAPLDDRPRFRGGVVLRGLRSLPLRGRRARVRSAQALPGASGGRSAATRVPPTRWSNPATSIYRPARPRQCASDRRTFVPDRSKKGGPQGSAQLVSKRRVPIRGAGSTARIAVDLPTEIRRGRSGRGS